MSPIMDSEIINGVSQGCHPTDDAKEVLWKMVEKSGEMITDH